MRVHVIGNAAFDDILAVAEWPTPGASIHGRPVASGPGGKGANQAVMLARAGVATQLVAGLGEDSRGTAIRAALAAEPLTLGLLAMPEHATDFSMVLSGPDAENAIVTTTDCAGALTPAMAHAALADAETGDLLLVQGNLTEATTRAALETAADRGLRRVMNPSPLRPWQAALLPLCDCVFANTGEALALTGRTGAEAANALHAAGVTDVVLTLGSAGAMLTGRCGIVQVAAAPALVRDTTGAGDAFLGATLASSLLRGTGLDAMALAAGARAAALAVARPGAFAALPSIAEIAAILA